VIFIIEEVIVFRRTRVLKTSILTTEEKKKEGVYKLLLEI
jgi:hypothetical protein